LTILADTPTPWAMNIPQTDTTIEHRCEALTISEIPPYRCTTSATGARQGREVCPGHASSRTSVGSMMAMMACPSSRTDLLTACCEAVTAGLVGALLA
jgi:hypothetical protein